MENKILKVESGYDSAEIHRVSINLTRYVILLCLISFLPACGTYRGYDGFYPYDSYYPYDYSYPYYFYPYYFYPDGYYYCPSCYRYRDDRRHKKHEDRFERHERRDHFDRPGKPPGDGRGLRGDGLRGDGFRGDGFRGGGLRGR